MPFRELECENDDGEHLLLTLGLAESLINCRQPLLRATYGIPPVLFGWSVARPSSHYSNLLFSNEDSILHGSFRA